MRRIGLAVALALSLLALPAVSAQQTTKVPRIGYLVLSPLVDPPSAERQALLDGLRDLGYVIGRNVVMEYRSANWNRELLPDLAAELVDLKVDVIVAQSPIELKAAQQATKTIPIVMVVVGDPVKSGFVRSLARISQGFPARRRRPPASRLNYSKRSFPRFPGSPFCRTRIT